MSLTDITIAIAKKASKPITPPHLGKALRYGVGRWELSLLARADNDWIPEEILIREIRGTKFLTTIDYSTGNEDHSINIFASMQPFVGISGGYRKQTVYFGDETAEYALYPLNTKPLHLRDLSNKRQHKKK